MFIERIHVKNFRSIVDQVFYAKDLTIFVGNNDVGKSNVLKALNLFFTGQTEFNSAFNFNVDYSRYAIEKKKKAKEISIEILFVPPRQFRDHQKKVLWRRVWRETGEHVDSEQMTFADKTKIPQRSRLRVWLKRLQFRYVPAIKSSDFFSFLLRELYKTLYLTIKQDLQSAGKNFIGKIREHTSPLSKDIEAILGISSHIQLPSDLSDLFSTLDFETKVKGASISLKQRGDGLKARHIPVILKFLAEKEQLHHISGAVRVDTIWGYEEPENNLELSRSFDLANEFAEHSINIQIFLTTHSPAFYSVVSESRQLYHISQNEMDSPSIATVVDTTSTQGLDKAMGLLPIVAPYVEKKQAELLDLKRILEDLKDNTKPVLFVEGISDKMILESAWKKLRRGKRMPFKIQDAFDCYFIANTFQREEVFKNYPDTIFIGLLDFDSAYECWEKIKDKRDKAWQFAQSDPSNGLWLSHKRMKGHVFLLPVPSFRKAYASESFGKNSKLSIELLFNDSIVKDYVLEKDMPGGGKLYEISDDKKVKFADSTAKLLKADFKYFEPIFQRIETIILLGDLL